MSLDHPRRDPAHPGLPHLFLCASGVPPAEGGAAGAEPLIDSVINETAAGTFGSAGDVFYVS